MPDNDWLGRPMQQYREYVGYAYDRMGGARGAQERLSTINGAGQTAVNGTPEEHARAVENVVTVYRDQWEGRASSAGAASGAAAPPPPAPGADFVARVRHAEQHLPPASARSLIAQLIREEYRSGRSPQELNALHHAAVGFAARAAASAGRALTDEELLMSSPLFDENHYRDAASSWASTLRTGPIDLPDRAAAVRHFLGTGAKAGLSCSAGFATSYYAGRNPQVAAAGMNPLVHFLKQGLLEGRWPVP